MPKKYVKKKPPPNYSEEDLFQAIQDVQNKNKSLRDAALFYGIPHTVIFYKIKGRKALDGTIRIGQGVGRPRALDDETESTIAECIKARAKMGCPCDKEELFTLIQEYVNINNLKTPFKDNRPGEDWYLNFMRRNPSLRLKKPEQIQKVRIEARIPEVVYNFYDMIENLYKEKFVSKQGSFVFNCDETGFPSDPSKLRALGERGVPLSRMTGGSGRDNTSVLACVSADGFSLPPLIIFKGAAVQSRWTSEKAYPGTTYSTSKNGWMEESVFYNWFAEVFVPFVNNLRGNKNQPEQHAVLCYDGHHSHYSLQIIEMAINHNISLLKLPSHLTDKLQPLDKCVFGPIKTLWDKKLVNFGKKQIGTGTCRLTKHSFSELLGEVWREGMKPENIIKGFLTTGIFPVNKAKFDKSLFNQRDLRDYEQKKERLAVRPVFLSNIERPEKLNPSPLKQRRILGPSKIDITDEESVLDLSIRIYEPSPIKCTSQSIIDIFAEKIRSAPTSAPQESGPHPSKNMIRLKQLKYGEVLTSEKVFERLAEAEAVKKEKENKKQTRDNRKMKEKTQPYSDTENDPAEDQMVLESEEEEVKMGEYFLNDKEGDKAKVGDFVLVEFKRPKLKENLYYVGQVKEDETPGFTTVSFLRKKSKAFVWPNVEDKTLVSRKDIKIVLGSNPYVRRGYYNFKKSFPMNLNIQ